MHHHRQFSVRAKLPEELAPLLEIAMNMGWISYERAEDLFRLVDPENWEFGSLDPFSRLTRAPQHRLDELAANPSFVARAEVLLADLRNSLHVPRWFQLERPDSPLRQVAYFSPEFGIAQALPQYSGGLGVLAGDHLKAANDLGIPLVAIGLLYQHGYFRQSLDLHGWQQEHFPFLDPRNMALRPVENVEIDVDIDHHQVRVRVWEALVGRLSLYLLDTNHPDNDPEERLITDRLYGGGNDQRIRQELVLGVGGMRLLDQLGLRPDVFHLNEGHAAFLALERIRWIMATEGLRFDEAVEAVRPANVFTTHTPVPAGIDRFDRALVEAHFGWWFDACGTTIDDLMALGHEPGTAPGEHLNMAVLALRLSGAANGVSQLHGQVSRRMFGSLWPDVPEHERPIGSVTNGVHAHTWVSREMNDLLDRHIGHDWSTADTDRWAALADVPDEQLRAVRATNKGRLVRYVRRRVRHQLIGVGASPGDVEWTDRLLDPDVLTIGFARRFATYKRATLLLRDIDRLERLIHHPERPVQFVFAGKAHPADDPGKALIQDIARLASDPRFRERFVFLHDYDIAVGRMLTQGVDVWLNNPLRPHEASGTSGMKVAFNGGLSCSILDGWWAELYRNDLGWAIPSALGTDGPERDRAEAEYLYRMLEDVVAPAYYERAGERPPSAWLDRVRASMQSLCPQVEAGRMLRQYVTEYYEPAAARARRITADGAAAARSLAAWKQQLTRHWDSLRIVDARCADDAVELGAPLQVTATVELGKLHPEDVAVQVVHGPVDGAGTMTDPAVTEMVPAGRRGAVTTYTAELAPSHAGSFAYTIRIVPHHAELAHFAWGGHITWLDLGDLDGDDPDGTDPAAAATAGI